jgi:enediyne biosynthesis protein E4
VAVGDFNGDGLEDVILGGTTRDPARIFLQQANEVFGPVPGSGISSTAPVVDGPILVFDANADRKLDLLVTKAGNALPPESPEYVPQLYLGNGDGTFAAASEGAVPAIPLSAGAAVSADFDRDGQLDVFIGARLVPGMYPVPARSVLLRNEHGTFSDLSDLWAPALREIGLVTGVACADLDADGWTDLLVALDWGYVRYFHNDGGKRFEDRSEQAGFAAAGTGWWTALACADLNGDGRPDVIAGNVGLNTPYVATKDRPAVLYYGDMRATGALQLVEAYYEGDRLLPVRSRRELGASFPAVLKKYPRNDGYAAATLPEILGDTVLSSGSRLEAQNLNSGVFLSQPDGRYVFRALPRIAQISPVQSIIVNDFDGDGHPDLFLAQNSYAPSAANGRYDGGLGQLLRNHGDGTFAPVPIAESHLELPGEAKSSVILHLGRAGVPSLLVTRNNATTLLFRSTQAERPSK